MRVLVCGGRNYSNMGRVFRELNVLRPTCIIEGGASGADQLANKWAIATATPCHTYPADWKLHGRSAGPKRNQLMLTQSKPDLVLAFSGGNGTADMVRRAKTANIRVVEIIDDAS